MIAVEPAPATLPAISIPDPMRLRQAIGFKTAELGLLRKLLRIAEDNARLRKSESAAVADAST